MVDSAVQAEVERQMLAEAGASGAGDVPEVNKVLPKTAKATFYILDLIASVNCISKILQVPIKCDIKQSLISFSRT